jgi:DNA-binding transcriptional regulator YiaG
MNSVDFKLALKDLSMSQARLARILDCAPSTVTRWSQGRCPVPGAVAAYLRLALNMSTASGLLKSGLSS